MPRKYSKVSSYWHEPRKPVVMTVPNTALSMGQSIVQAAPLDVFPAFDTKAHYTATAACGGGNVAPLGAVNSAGPSIFVNERYPNIRQGVMPFQTVEGNYGVSETIGVTYQCYFLYAPLRNVINMMVDYSLSRIHVKTPNKKLKGFIETWFDAIGLNQFMSQFFLEYYRSGNVFIYKFSGRISNDGFNMIKESYSSVMETKASKSPVIPIRYIILNPMQVYLQRGASYTYGYVRMLSTYEIERLKNPQTDEDKQIFKSFPIDIQRQIKQGGAWRYLFVPLDQNRLYYVFYRKQDYEPLAVPMAFPVLNDIEFKLQLRQMDLSLITTMQQVILLITTGRKADQFNSVSGAKNLQALQDLFSSQAIGRVLVADYTTKGEWLIPDLKGLLGPEKYQRVDQDIKEGLQYMFFGEDKFANASVKVKIFTESLKEGRRAFIENFLLPEVKKICEVMSFKNIPELEFEDIQLQDETVMNRLYVQLAQLGLLDPNETFTAMRTGMLPNKDESLDHQNEYKDERAKGLYTPLIGGPQAGGGMNGRPNGTGGTPAPRGTPTPVGQTKKVGKPMSAKGSDSRFFFGVTKIADNLVKMNGLKDDVEVALLKKWKLKKLNSAQQDVAAALAKSIVFNEPESKWDTSIASYMKTPKEIDPPINAELHEIAAEFDVDTWMAAVMARSQVSKPETPQEQ